MKNVVDNDRSTWLILRDGSSNFRRIIERGIWSVVRSIVESFRRRRFIPRGWWNLIFHLEQAELSVERVRGERGLNAANIARAKIEIQRCNRSVENTPRRWNFFGGGNLILNIQRGGSAARV